MSVDDISVLMNEDPFPAMHPTGDPVATAEAFAAEQSAAGYVLDFSLASLEIVVDRLIELPMCRHGCEGQPSEAEERTQSAIGAYIGETLRRLFEGEWVGAFHPASTALNFYRSFVMFGDYRFSPHLFIAYRFSNGACEGSFQAYLRRALPRITARSADGDALLE